MSLLCVEFAITVAVEQIERSLQKMLLETKGAGNNKGGARDPFSGWLSSMCSSEPERSEPETLRMRQRLGTWIFALSDIARSE